MAFNPIRLLFNKITATQKQIGSVQIDAFIEENHVLESSVTSYPVENGSEISDHVVLMPFRLELSAAIGPGNSLFNNGIVSTNKPLEIYNQLTELREKKIAFTVVTGLKVYDNMIFTSLSVPRNSQNGKSLSFSASLRQIKKAENQTVAIPKDVLKQDGTTELQAQSEVEVGKASSGETQLSDVLARAEQLSNETLNTVFGEE